MQRIDQIGIAAFGLGLRRFKPGENFLDAVDRAQDQRHGLAGHRHAVAEFAHQRLGGMRQRLEPRQAEKAAGALDGVNQAKDVIQDFRVVRILLEPHQLVVDGVETLVGLRQELAQQIIHGTGLNAPARDIARGFTSRGQFRRKAFKFG